MRRLILCLIMLCLGFQTQAENDTRAVRKESNDFSFNKLNSHSSDQLSLSSHNCLRPGDVLTIAGENLPNLNNYHLVLRNKKSYIPLKALSISSQKLILQVPRDVELTAGHEYPIVMLLTMPSANVSKPTGSSIKICKAFDVPALLPIKESHETGEILVLANSGLVDPITKQSIKLGYLPLRRHQLNSLNLTLMAFGGGEKHLDKAIQSLSSTFPDAQIDYNHHFYTSGQVDNHYPRKDISQAISCQNKPMSRVKVGMLDGDIDMSHPALAGKSIKTKSFLLSGEAPDQDHATAIATLLVGSQIDDKFKGYAPFIELKAASVIREDQPVPIATAEAITQALDWFINEKVRLLNVSLTSPVSNKITNKLFTAASEHHIIIFAAAGNDGKKLTPAYPGVLPNVITITAVDAEGEVYSAANQGNYIDFAAPGVDIWTASSKVKGMYRSGTSLAVPHAVSIAAFYLARQPDTTQKALFKSLQHNAVDLGNAGYDRRYGWGQIKMNHEICSP